MPENFQFSFSCSFFLHSKTAQFNLTVYGAVKIESELKKTVTMGAPWPGPDPSRILRALSAPEKMEGNDVL